MSYLSRQASLEYQIISYIVISSNRGSAHWHALSLINHGDASDGGGIDKWDWRRLSEDDDQGDNKYCTTSDNDKLVTHLLHL